ncbi:hypothetical protein QFW96_05605 [Saccharopolyspora sp. TS4A08]|uniref:Uncharacterized protein n=1 Tax=Saccharopolyspora ipomoeae TaxID=3042027 RepID=A0ABT6PK85_9PSEU|nr:hypothetical protein [Saccharopolyspora sp. TS4A08]MDI2028073.1 hypothetical protein [Saccharopolyspora sp. TS4A08]
MPDDATRIVARVSGSAMRMSRKVKILLWSTFAICVVTNAVTSFAQRPPAVPFLLGLLTTACAVALFAQHRRR